MCVDVQQHGDRGEAVNPLPTSVADVAYLSAVERTAQFYPTSDQATAMGEFVDSGRVMPRNVLNLRPSLAECGQSITQRVRFGNRAQTNSPASFLAPGLMAFQLQSELANEELGWWFMNAVAFPKLKMRNSATALPRTPRGPNSTAANSVSIFNAALSAT
jgi:hypothetical protein